MKKPESFYEDEELFHSQVLKIACFPLTYPLLLKQFITNNNKEAQFLYDLFYEAQLVFI